jgi:uncharacterized iron-regulated membrane protein
MAAVPGSLFRRVLFWSHLSSGIAAGIFIFIMSATGVLLAYEHQIMDWAGRRNHVSTLQAPLDADRLAQIALQASPSGPRPSLVFEASPTAPVTVSRGRDGSILLNPNDGSVIEDSASGLRSFFRVVEDWHRRAGGDGQSTRAKLIDYGNLLFLFIVISGIYIWLPQVWRWRTIKGKIATQPKYVNAKVRDYNWHNAFSFWMLIPLFLISASGVMMSFPWANKLVYAAYGEEVPQRRGPQIGNGQGGGGPGGGQRNEERGPRPERDAGAEGPRASFEALRQAAAAQVTNWTKMTLPLSSGPQVEVAFELKSDEVRPPRQTVTLNAVDGSVVKVVKPQPNAQTPGQRARSWLRFVHTGEQYGIIGQTLAFIASFAACLLVYTGLALAYRRLIRPLFSASQQG